MAERPRDTRFALVNVAFLSDPKFVKLARSVSRDRFNAAVGVWLQMLCAARQARSSEVDWEDWDDDEQAVADLRNARLLNGQGFDSDAFDTWAPKKVYPSDLLRNTTQALHKTTQLYAASPSPSIRNGKEIEEDAAEGSVAARSGQVFMGFRRKMTPAEKAEDQRRLAEIKRQTEEEWRKHHPNWEPG